MPLQRTKFRNGNEGSSFGHSCEFDQAVKLNNGASISGSISGLVDVDIEGDLDVGGSLSVSGNAVIRGDLVINGTLTLQLGGSSYTLTGVFEEPDTGNITVIAEAV